MLPVGKMVVHLQDCLLYLQNPAPDHHRSLKCSESSVFWLQRTRKFYQEKLLLLYWWAMFSFSFKYKVLYTFKQTSLDLGKRFDLILCICFLIFSDRAIYFVLCSLKVTLSSSSCVLCHFRSAFLLFVCIAFISSLNHGGIGWILSVRSCNGTSCLRCLLVLYCISLVIYLH